MAPSTYEFLKRADVSVLANDPAHADHATFNRIDERARGTGRWDESKSLDVTSALYREVADSPLIRRVDRVVGGIARDGAENVFAVHAPFGDKEPTFHTHVDGRRASEQPAQQTPEQADVIRQDRPQVQAMEPQQSRAQAKAR